MSAALEPAYTMSNLGPGDRISVSEIESRQRRSNLGFGAESCAVHSQTHAPSAYVPTAPRMAGALAALTVDDLKGLHPLFEPDVMAVWDFEAAVERRDATGGTSKRSVLAQAAALEKWAESKAAPGLD